MYSRSVLAASVALACLATSATADAGKGFYRFSGSFGEGVREDDPIGLAFPRLTNVLLGGTVISAPARYSGPTIVAQIQDGEMRVCEDDACDRTSSWSSRHEVRDGVMLQMRRPGPVSPGATVATTVFFARQSVAFTATARVEAPSFDTIADETAASGVARDGELSTFRGWVETPISVTGGEYRVCASNGSCGSFTTATSTIRDGDQVQLRVVAGAAGTKRMATVSAGGATASFTVTNGTSADGTPDAFSFSPMAGATNGGAYDSNLVRLTGMEAPGEFAVSSNRSGYPLVSINGGAFEAAPASVPPNATIQLRMQTSSEADGSTDYAEVSVGGTLARWSIVLADEVPDQVRFKAVASAEPNQENTSEEVTLNGFDQDASYSVENGTASVNDGAFNASGVVSPGSRVRLRAVSSGFGEPAKVATLTVRSMTAGWTISVRDEDTVPDAVSMNDGPVSAEPGADQTSAPTTLTGFDSAPISISGTGASYSLNGGAFTSIPGVAKGGDSLRIRLASGSFGETRTAVVSVGGTTASFSATTRPKDTTPDAFDLGAPVIGGQSGTTYASTEATLSGFDDAPISVSGPTAAYSINGGGFTSAAGTVRSGDRVVVRMTSGSPGEIREAVLDIGGTTRSFRVESRAVDATPDPFTLGPMITSAEPGTVQTSQIATLGGFDTAVASLDGGAQLSVNGATFGTASMTVAPGDTVQVRFTAGAFGETRTSTLSIGGTSASFSVSTRAKDVQPDAITFVAKSDAVPAAETLSDIRRLTGHEGIGLSVSGTAAQLRTCTSADCATGTGGGWSTSIADVPSGAYVQLRMVAGAADETRVATLVYGSLSTTWSVKAVDQNPRTIAGNLYAWGNNQIDTNNYTQPYKVAFPAGVTSISNIQTYDGTNCAFGSDGATYCWGVGTSGQIGNGQSSNQYGLTKVTMPPGVARFKEISPGADHTCGIGSDDNAYCWGGNNGGQLGSAVGATNVPTKVQAPAGIVFSGIKAGSATTCAIGSDRNGYCWGSNSTGELGNGSKNNTSVPTKVVNPPGTTGFKVISEGTSGRCGIASDDNIYCWGDNNYGSIGNGTKTQSSVPVKVTNPAGVTSYSDLTAGTLYFCAVGSDRQSYCWGYNPFGNLGDGTTTDRSVPTKVVVPAGLTSLTFPNAGAYVSCAVGSDNHAYCWGRNHKGQLGNGTLIESAKPTKVVLPTEVKSFGPPTPGGWINMAISR